MASMAVACIVMALCTSILRDPRAFGQDLVDIQQLQRTGAHRGASADHSSSSFADRRPAIWGASKSAARPRRTPSACSEVLKREGTLGVDAAAAEREGPVDVGDDRLVVDTDELRLGHNYYRP